jgi:hypothetical protein
MKRFALAVQVALMVVGVSIVAGAQTFTAGAGRMDVKIPSELYPIDGFTAQHDPMVTRILLMDDGNQRMGIVVVDQTSISEGAIASMKAILRKVTGVLPENSIVVASHTFSAPHAMSGPNIPEELKKRGIGLEQAIEEAVQGAATQAKANMQPARVGFGLGTSLVNVNRDVPTPQGWWLGSNDSGYADHSLALIRIDALDGKPLAFIMNMAVQSSIMDHSVDEKAGKLITSDLAGAATHYLESHYGSNAVALFLIGAAGDQEPYLKANRHVVNKDGSSYQVDIHEAGFTLVDLLGERLGEDALQVSEAIKATEVAPKPQVLRQSVEVPSLNSSRTMPSGPVTSYAYQPGPKIEVPVVLMRIGDIAIVGLQPELAASVGNQIKASSPFTHTIVVTMVDGGAKYMPDAASYDRFTYEARNTRYAKGAAEMTASQIVGLLKQMHDRGIPKAP